MDDTADAIAYQEVLTPPYDDCAYLQEVSNLLASKVTSEEEDEVLEEFEQLRREALGLPEVPIHTLPQKDPGVKVDQSTVPEEEPEHGRQAILA